MPPTVSVVLLAAACGLLIALLVISGRIWIRLRTPPEADVARLLLELKEEQRALREAFDRLGPAGPSARGLTPPEPRSQRIDRAEANAVAGPTLIAVPNLAAAPSATSAANEELGQRFAPIWAMADRGISPETIALQTGQPIGQIELILGLRRPFAAHTAPAVRTEGRN